MNSDELADFQRALVMVAHPDDAEFGSAGTVALWTTRGVRVDYVVFTNGAAGAADQEVDISQLPALREREQREAADVLGVSEIVFLGQPDGALRPTPELRQEVVRLLRRFRPEVVICQNAVRNYASLYGNHPDHLAAGQLVLEAIYPYARNPHAYPELLEEGLLPHSVRDVLVAGTDSPDHFVDVTEILDRKLLALSKHRSQQRPGQDFAEGVKARMARMGEPRGMAFAESFRHIAS